MQHSAFLINAIYSKLTKYFGIFYKIKIRNKLPPLILKNVYFAFVHPQVLYGVEVHANTGDVHLQKLITLYIKLLRILQSKSYDYPTCI